MSTPLDLALPLQRLLWLEGQRLMAGDMRYALENTDRLRALHVRYMHRTWGIVQGLGVDVKKRGVLVEAGVALDSEGSLLLLPEGGLAPALPELPSRTTLYLVLFLGSACGCGPAPMDVSTLCPGAADQETYQQATLAWKTMRDVVVGTDLLLARALVERGKIQGVVDTRIQRHATTMRQARVWSDTTSSGQTGWTDSDSKGIRGIKAKVDASDAGFLGKPVYMAQLSGASGNVPVAAQSISSADSTGFTLQLCFPAHGESDPPDAKKAEADGWTVTWFAVERPS